ncbi:hypothetical protein TgHK011_005427 [Trichoderma gracile]|nr:hypothetical protein TgHK011_005427 [Trichoderma gracile]
MIVSIISCCFPSGRHTSDHAAISTAETSFGIRADPALRQFLPRDSGGCTTFCDWVDTGFPSEATARGTAEISRSTRRSGLSGQATWSPARHRPMESRHRIPAVTQLEETVPQATRRPLSQL